MYGRCIIIVLDPYSSMGCRGVTQHVHTCWNTCVVYLQLGDQYNATPARTLATAFQMDLSGGRAVTPKQASSQENTSPALAILVIMVLVTLEKFQIHTYGLLSDVQFWERTLYYFEYGRHSLHTHTNLLMAFLYLFFPFLRCCLMTWWRFSLLMNHTRRVLTAR